GVLRPGHGDSGRRHGRPGAGAPREWPHRIYRATRPRQRRGRPLHHQGARDSRRVSSPEITTARGAAVPPRDTTGGTPKIAARNVTKIYATAAGPITALSDFSLDVADGEFVCIVGPSGCGKSTFLRMLAGLEDISSGTIDI